MKRATVLACLSLLLAIGPAAGQDVRVHVSADSVAVGDRFLLSVTARHDFASAPDFPDPDTTGGLAFGDVEVVELSARDSYTLDGMRVDSVVYEVTTFALDTAHVAPIPILFTVGEDTFTVRTDPTWIPVVSLVPPDAEGIRDLAPLVDFRRPLWPYVAAAAALLLVAALLALYLRRRRRRGGGPAPAPPPEPDREAFERLDALERMDLSNAANIPLFYDELSGILRTYTARRLHVPALELTTNEIMGELRRVNVPDPATKERLRGVLVAADLVKFAGAVPAAAEGMRDLSAARAVVRATEDQLHPKETEAADAEPVQ